jgi:hypothetical protein
MKDRETDTDTATETDSEGAPSTGSGDRTSGAGAHTELRPAGSTPRPRSKVVPPELGDEPGEDDPFNDMPV